MQSLRSLFVKVAAVAGLALAAAGSAHAGGHWSVGVNIGGPVLIGQPQPVYVPPPVVYQPQPQVVYTQPQVVYTQPQVVYPAGYHYQQPVVVVRGGHRHHGHGHGHHWRGHGGHGHRGHWR